MDADASGNVQLGNLGVITGEIKWFAFNKAPNGYLICDGTQVSRTTYADLFKAIGTTFGKGDGSTTFTLPNLINKFAQGSTTVGTAIDAGLPNITGNIYNTPSINNATSANGAFRVSLGDGARAGTTGKGYNTSFNASLSNPIYGNSTTVQPPALTLLPCIKY